MNTECKAPKVISVALALAIIFVAVFAGMLGLDPDNRWGGSRSGLLILGFAILVVVLINQWVDVLDRRLLARSHKARHKPDGSSLERAQSIKPRKSFLHSQWTRWAGLSVLFIVVELLYLGLASGVHLAQAPRGSAFYNLLADAFLHGQNSLLIEPPPALELLDNPWPLNERGGISVPTDFSYFNGKYYLYWGPAPALLTAAWKILSNNPVGDNYVTFLGVSLTFVFSFLSMLRIRRRFFLTVPNWLFGCFILFVATAHPMLWVLNPALIYDAAIASGQAFLLAGIYYVLPRWEEGGRETWKYFLVGVLWSLALASRLVLLGAIAVLVIGTGFLMLSSSSQVRGKKRPYIQIAALVLPLMITITLLGLYNYVRFESFFETGIRYQFSMNDLNQIIEDKQFMSLKYVPANIVYYLLTPLRFRGTFPFVRAFYTAVPGFSSIAGLLATPDIHYIENTTGIFSSVPLLLLIIPLAWKLICTFIEPEQLQNADTMSLIMNQRMNFAYRLFGILLIASLAAMLPFFLLFWVATRYLLDVIPLLALAAVLASMIYYTENYKYPLRGRFTTLLILFLSLTSVGISFLLAISGPDSLFDNLNPVLVNWVSALFTK